MKTIWKFPVPPTDEASILEMPQGAEILDIQVQGGGVQLWALVDPEADFETRIFRTYGTGHPIDHEPGRHVATYQLNGGGLIFHVFELGIEQRKRLAA